MPGFLLKAKNFIVKGGKAKAALDTASAGEEVIKKGFDIAGKGGFLLISLIIFPFFMVMLLVASVANAGDMETIFGAVGGFGEQNAYAAEGNGYYGQTTEVGKIVISCAVEQIGKPYVWGAEGPNSFDCSGLVKYCYKKAGVDVYHQTETAFNNAKSNPSKWEIYNIKNGKCKEAHPGDWLWRHGHAGIVQSVSDDGTITYVHAPTFNAKVRNTDAISWSNFTHVIHYVG